jgi:redox-sensitive bicupin YhaK (pirin superfamily)
MNSITLGEMWRCLGYSEYNASSEAQVHFLQIWIEPQRTGLAPDHEQRAFSEEARRNRLLLVGSRTGRHGAIAINRDVDLYASLLAPEAVVTHHFAKGRKGWLQIVRGEVQTGDLALRSGDGLRLQGADELTLTASSDAELLLFHMA